MDCSSKLLQGFDEGLLGLRKGMDTRCERCQDGSVAYIRSKLDRGQSLLLRPENLICSCSKRHRRSLRPSTKPWCRFREYFLRLEPRTSEFEPLLNPRPQPKLPGAQPCNSPIYRRLANFRYQTKVRSPITKSLWLRRSL